MLNAQIKPFQGFAWSFNVQGAPDLPPRRFYASVVPEFHLNHSEGSELVGWVAYVEESFFPDDEEAYIEYFAALDLGDIPGRDDEFVKGMQRVLWENMLKALSDENGAGQREAEDAHTGTGAKHIDGTNVIIGPWAEKKEEES